MCTGAKVQTMQVAIFHFFPRINLRFPYVISIITSSSSYRKFNISLSSCVGTFLFLLFSEPWTFSKYDLAFSSTFSYYDNIHIIVNDSSIFDNTAYHYCWLLHKHVLLAILPLSPSSYVIIVFIVVFIIIIICHLHHKTHNIFVHFCKENACTVYVPFMLHDWMH